MKKKILMSTVLVLCCSLFAFSQTTIRGYVLDANKRAIPGASVRIEQTNQGVATNFDGSFSITFSSDKVEKLRASAYGYNSKSFDVVESRDNFEIILMESPVNINQVVITGTGTHRRLKNSPVPVEVISSTNIKNSGAHTIESALTMLNPSFTFTSTAMSDKMFINGLDSKYLTVMIDGRKITGDISGSVDISRIDMGNVKRIEILKGAASSLYGSDAIAGVVNIITNRPKDQLNFISSSRVSEKRGYMQSFSLNANQGKIFSSTSYRRLQSDGWQLNPTEIKKNSRTGAITYEPTAKRAVNSFYSNVFNQRFGYSHSQNLSFYVQGSFYDRKSYRPIEAYNYNMFYQDYSYGAGTKYLTGKDGYLSMDYSSSVYQYSKIYTKESGSFKIGEHEKNKEQKYDVLNAKWVFSLLDFNKISLGAEYVNDNLESKSIKDGDKNVYMSSLYLQDELKIVDGLQLVVGGRYSYHQTFKGNFTPKASLMYTLGNFNIRTSYSAGFKAPSLLELFYEYESRGSISLGNKDLNPEKSHYGMFNLEYVGSNIYLSATGYVNSLRDMIGRKLIETRPEDAANGINKTYVYSNISKAEVKGIDLTLNSYIGYGISLGAGYSYTDAIDKDNDVRLNNTSMHSSNVNANWDKKIGVNSVNINLIGRYQSDRFYLGEDNAKQYQLWNLSFNGSYKGLRDIIIEPSIGVENIFDFVDDKPYGSNYATLSPGRMFYFSLVFKLNKNWR